MRLHLKSVNDELARRGYNEELAKGAGHFFFRGGEAEDWIDRTVAVRKINSLTLKQWVEEYRRLKTLNQQMMKTAKASTTAQPGEKPK
jgi:hypothetical protein